MKTWYREYRTSEGFTLVEVVVSMVILSFIVLIIGSAFRLGVNAWEKGENEATQIQSFRILSGLLSQQIKSAYPYKMEFDDEKVVVFKGESDSIMFVTLSNDPSNGALKWVRYRYIDGTLQYLEGIIPDKTLLERTPKEWEVIDSNIGEVKFSFLSSDDGEWNESWEFREDLPNAVSMRIGYFQPFFISVPMSTIKSEGETDNEPV
jgi:prepilin-type N-terminal cleavage/methylation domain-containing protein